MNKIGSFSKAKVTTNDFDIKNMISSGSYAKTHHGVLNCAVKRAGVYFYAHRKSMHVFLLFLYPRSQPKFVSVVM